LGKFFEAKMNMELRKHHREELKTMGQIKRGY
jgi:hypothetical protein